MPIVDVQACVLRKRKRHEHYASIKIYWDNVCQIPSFFSLYFGSSGRSKERGDRDRSESNARTKCCKYSPNKDGLIIIISLAFVVVPTFFSAAFAHHTFSNTDARLLFNTFLMRNRLCFFFLARLFILISTYWIHIIDSVFFSLCSCLYTKSVNHDPRRILKCATLGAIETRKAPFSISALEYCGFRI